MAMFDHQTIDPGDYIRWCRLVDLPIGPKVEVTQWHNMMQMMRERLAARETENSSKRP